MNDNIIKYRHQLVTKGFVKALICDDLVYKLIGQYISFKKPIYACIKDDLKKDDFDTVKALSEEIYVEGSEIIEVSEDDVTSVVIYKSKENIVLFIIKCNWSIAIWN